MQTDTDEGQQACDELGIDVIPTVQFWKSGAKLWEHKGIVALENDLGEGVLYFGDTAANNVRASDFVTDIKNRGQLDEWLSKPVEGGLHILDISLMGATPCVHIFPAVLALAKNMAGFASFSRLLADNGADAQALAKELKVVQVSLLVHPCHVLVCNFCGSDHKRGLHWHRSAICCHLSPAARQVPHLVA